VLPLFWELPLCFDMGELFSAASGFGDRAAAKLVLFYRAEGIRGTPALMRSGVELYVALMLALFEFFRGEFLRGLSCGDGNAAHEIVKTWGGEYKGQADIFSAGIS
jgi:hypothetical protein